MKCCFSSSLSAFPLMMSVISITRKRRETNEYLKLSLLPGRDDNGMKL